MKTFLYEYAILLHPEKKSETTILLIPPSYTWGSNLKVATMRAAKMIPDEYVNRIGNIEILIKRYDNKPENVNENFVTPNTAYLPSNFITNTPYHLNSPTVYNAIGTTAVTVNSENWVVNDEESQITSFNAKTLTKN